MRRQMPQPIEPDETPVATISDGNPERSGLPALASVPEKRDPEPFTWRDQTAYRCPFCPMDSLDEAAVIEHIAEKHPIPPPPITAAMPVAVPSAPADDDDPPASDSDDPDAPKQESTGDDPESGADNAPEEV